MGGCKNPESQAWANGSEPEAGEKNYGKPTSFQASGIPVFKRCFKCQLKICIANTHDLCLTCLGREHPMYECTRCLAIKLKVYRARFLRQFLWAVLFAGNKEKNVYPPMPLLSTRQLSQYLIDLQGIACQVMHLRLMVKSKFLWICPHPCQFCSMPLTLNQWGPRAWLLIALPPIRENVTSPHPIVHGIVESQLASPTVCSSIPIHQDGDTIIMMGMEATQDVP